LGEYAVSVGEKIEEWAKSKMVNLQAFERLDRKMKGEVFIYLVDPACQATKRFKATEALKELGVTVASLVYGSKCEKCGKAFAVVIRLE
jgi:hypothetical protein